MCCASQRPAKSVCFGSRGATNNPDSANQSVSSGQFIEDTMEVGTFCVTTQLNEIDEDVICSEGKGAVFIAFTMWLTQTGHLACRKISHGLFDVSSPALEDCLHEQDRNFCLKAIKRFMAFIRVIVCQWALEDFVEAKFHCPHGN